MVELDLKPNTEAWHNWRHQGIGSSDVPAILGVCPYKKRSAVFSEKVCPMPPIHDNKKNFILQQGHNAEHIIRGYISITQNVSINPLICEHNIHRWAKASIDMYCPDKKTFFEVKLCGADKIDLIKNKTIPDHYYAQIQWQLFTSGIKQAYLIGIPFTGRQIRPEQAVFSDIITYDSPDIFTKVNDFWTQVKTYKREKYGT